MMEYRKSTHVKDLTGMTAEDEELFFDTLEELCRNPDIQLMNKIMQHKGNTSLQHCRNVAVCSFALAKKFGWKVDVKSLAVGAMLHDYYLYDIEEQHISSYRHGTQHPGIALKNAEKIVDLNDTERNIILSHMWPLPFSPMPRSREAVLVMLADKYCAIQEMYLHKKEVMR